MPPGDWESRQHLNAEELEVMDLDARMYFLLFDELHGAEFWKCGVLAAQMGVPHVVLETNAAGLDHQLKNNASLKDHFVRRSENVKLLVDDRARADAAICHENVIEFAIEFANNYTLKTGGHSVLDSILDSAKRMIGSVGAETFFHCDRPGIAFPQNPLPATHPSLAIRDRNMASEIRKCASSLSDKTDGSILAVVGAAHVHGLMDNLRDCPSPASIWIPESHELFTTKPRASNSPLPNKKKKKKKK